MKYQSQEEIAQTWEWIHRGRTHQDPTDERAAFREMLDSHEGKQKKNGGTGQKSDESRRLQITWADTITPEPVRWGWIHHDQGRIALGSLAVAAGREGCGKSQFGIWLAAQITNGTLPGLLFGKPRRVLIVATEDSWKHTIVPRLMAASANRSMVGRVDAISEGDEALTISLPKETSLLEVEINKHDVALVILDPMLSAITADLDSYRVRDMRSAIEPLVAVADRTGCLMLGIAHFNKGNGTDVATLLSGSHAFRDIPRAIFGFAKTKTERVLSQVKNSLGRDDLPSFVRVLPHMSFSVRPDV
jgi:predicted ATP-dependent serine protease